MASSVMQRAGRARDYVRTPEFAKFLRYSGVSAVSTVLSLGLLILFYDVIKVGSATESNLLATSIAAVPSYYLNRTWAWGKTGRSHLMREVVPFWVIAIISIILSTEAVRLATHEAHHVTHSHDIVTLIVLFANFFTYAVLWVVKFALFNKVLFKGHHGDDDGASGSGFADSMSSPNLGTVTSLEVP